MSKSLLLVGGYKPLWPTPSQAEMFDEVWGLNDVGRKLSLPWTKYFDLHDFRQYEMPEPQINWHWGPGAHMPVYCHQNSTELFPRPLLFPFDAIRERYRAHEKSYFSSTLAWLLAYAGMDASLTHITLAGIAQAHAEEYAAQKPCTLYWLGRLVGMGVDLQLVKGCPLFTLPREYATGKALT